MVRRDDFVIGPKEKAVQAIIAGKTKEALGYLNDVYEQFRTLHDSYSNTINWIQGILAETQGDEWFEAFNRTRIFESFRPRFERWKEMSPEKRLEEICRDHRAHYSEFHVEEDGEKFIVVITGCNAGARLIRDGIAKKQNAITKKAYPWSFNRIGFPHYCAHAYFFNELWKELDIKAEVQWGCQYDDQGNKIDEPCKYIIHK
jgi:hypothetical protein